MSSPKFSKGDKIIPTSKRFKDMRDPWTVEKVWVNAYTLRTPMSEYITPTHTVIDNTFVLDTLGNRVLYCDN